MSNRRKKSQKVNQKVLIATVDIGKKSHYGYWRSYRGADCRPFEFANTRAGFETFWRTIRTARDQQKADSVIVGFESTGSYGETLVHFLRMKPVQLVQTNPMHTKRVKELSDNSPLKSDAKDPRVIADILQLGHRLSVIVPTGPAAELRRLTNARERAVADRTALLNRLQDRITIVFPEFLTVMNGVQSVSARYLLKRYPLPEAVIRFGQHRLAKKLHTLSRGQLGGKRAAALIAAARESVGITEGRESIRLEIRHLLAQIASAQTFIGSLEAEMEKYIAMIPYRHSLLSIKGIGTVTAAAIIGEAGDFNAFHSAKAVIKLAGLNLYEVSSGIHKGTRRITRRGRPLLRKLLFFVAMNAVKKGAIMHAYYQKRIQQGMPPMKVLVAVMRKLVRIMYALVRDNTTYIVEYSIKKAA
jgi:transposase